MITQRQPGVSGNRWSAAQKTEVGIKHSRFEDFLPKLDAVENPIHILSFHPHHLITSSSSILVEMKIKVNQIHLCFALFGSHPYDDYN